jgi:hypothetical protein
MPTARSTLASLTIQQHSEALLSGLIFQTVRSAVVQGKWPEAVSSLISGHYPMESYAELLLSRPKGIKNVLSIA